MSTEKVKIFDQETGKLYTSKSFIFNCHICGKTFSPLEVTLLPTSYCAYYGGVYSRLYLIKIVSGNICNCININHSFRIFIHEQELGHKMFFRKLVRKDMTYSLEDADKAIKDAIEFLYKKK